MKKLMIPTAKKAQNMWLRKQKAIPEVQLQFAKKKAWSFWRLSAFERRRLTDLVYWKSPKVSNPIRNARSGQIEYAVIVVYKCSEIYFFFWIRTFIGDFAVAHCSGLLVELRVWLVKGLEAPTRLPDDAGLMPASEISWSVCFDKQPALHWIVGFWSEPFVLSHSFEKRFARNEREGNQSSPWKHLPSTSNN